MSCRLQVMPPLLLLPMLSCTDSRSAVDGLHPTLCCCLPVVLWPQEDSIYSKQYAMEMVRFAREELEAWTRLLPQPIQPDSSAEVCTWPCWLCSTPALGVPAHKWCPPAQAPCRPCLTVLLPAMCGPLPSLPLPVTTGPQPNERHTFAPGAR